MDRIKAIIDAAQRSYFFNVAPIIEINSIKNPVFCFLSAETAFSSWAGDDNKN